MLDVTSLSLTLGGRPILRDVTFSLTPGRITALLGKNGSGKTTLLRALAHEIPYEGEIRLGGIPTATLPPRERARILAYLPQLLPATPLTVRELVTLGRSPYLPPLARLSEDDRRAVLSAMQKTGVDSLSDRSLLSLSGGERQRAFLAMLVAQSTPLLLLDEPTSHLDAPARHRFLSLLGTLAHDEGKTVLIVLHDINDALHLADDIALMENGRLTFHGTKEDFLAAGFPARHFGLTAVTADASHPFFY